MNSEEHFKKKMSGLGKNNESIFFLIDMNYMHISKNFIQTFVDAIKEHAKRWLRG